MKSTVLIIPAAMRDAGNAVAGAMGWGPNSYSVALFTDDTITHYGLHTYSGEQFEAWVTGQEALPDGMESAQPVIDALIHSVREDIADAEHFAQVLADNGLGYSTEQNNGERHYDV